MRFSRFLLFGVLLILGLVLAACGASTQSTVTSNEASTSLTKNADGFTDISVAQLSDMLKEKDFTLVNVHIPYSGDIPQTDVSIPYNRIQDNLNKLPENKDAPIVVYCRSGAMSTAAAKTLVSLGYTNVMEVDGGMNAWQAAGNQLVTK